MILYLIVGVLLVRSGGEGGVVEQGRVVGRRLTAGRVGWVVGGGGRGGTAGGSGSRAVDGRVGVGRGRVGPQERLCRLLSPWGSPVVMAVAVVAVVVVVVMVAVVVVVVAVARPSRYQVRLRVHLALFLLLLFLQVIF